MPICIRKIIVHTNSYIFGIIAIAMKWTKKLKWYIFMSFYLNKMEIKYILSQYIGEHICNQISDKRLVSVIYEEPLQLNNIGRTPLAINPCKIFFNPPPGIMKIKTKIKKWDLIKLKNFVQQKKS